MQLDADEDGEPFFKPPGIGAAPTKPKDERGPGSSEGNAHGAAATVTAEHED